MTLEDVLRSARSGGFGPAHLPLGVMASPGGGRVVARLGEFAIDLGKAMDLGVLARRAPATRLRGPTLNPFLSLGAATHAAIRADLQAKLRTPGEAERLSGCLVPLEGVRLAPPLAPPDFVDFYASEAHARRSRRAMTGDDRLASNWRSMPIGYHSRAGAILPTGAGVVRPCGQVRTDDGVRFTPTAELDFELEIGFVVREPSAIGQRVSADDFARHVYGVVLLNDWSARDLQRWESTPLGPFHAKSFATQAADWVTPLDALSSARLRSPSESGALPYLRPQEPWGFDLSLDIRLQTRRMREAGVPPEPIADVRFADMHWNGAQQLAHLTANGAPLRTGDLFGSGTVSDAREGACGCLLELTEAGRRPLQLRSGERRAWLEDGDTLVFGGSAPGPDGERIELASLTGVVLPAV